MIFSLWKRLFGHGADAAPGGAAPASAQSYHPGAAPANGSATPPPQAAVGRDGDDLRLRDDDWSVQVTCRGDPLFFVRVERGLDDCMRVTDLILGAQESQTAARALDLALTRCGRPAVVTVALPETHDTLDQQRAILAALAEYRALAIAPNREKRGDAQGQGLGQGQGQGNAFRLYSADHGETP
ncbi:MAG: hypothetical protein AAF577_16030 [Pseudomonadota bacterium]